MQSRSTDVLVIGGGPAGLAAAIALRRRGLRVMVADHAAAPIDKACGEGLMPDNLAVLHQLGITLDDYPTQEFRGIKFVGAEGSAAADFPHGCGRGSRRVVLHQALIDHADRAGVEMLWQARILLRDRTGISVNGTPVRHKWLIGADGQNSSVRDWAGLDAGRIRSQRIGLRSHFRAAMWSEFVEIHWGASGQAYVTPVAEDQICVALISRKRFASFEAGVAEFPILAAHLGNAEPCSRVRGALTVARQLKAVTRDNVALIGDASGSVDAITGEGLAIAFRQAVALADALSRENLQAYELAHRKISRLPSFMGRSMLMMDAHPWLRRQALRSFAKQPRVFKRLLRLHVGEVPFAALRASRPVDMSWREFAASEQRLSARNGEPNDF